MIIFKYIAYAFYLTLYSALVISYMAFIGGIMWVLDETIRRGDPSGFIFVILGIIYIWGFWVMLDKTWLSWATYKASEIDGHD